MKKSMQFSLCGSRIGGLVTLNGETFTVSADNNQMPIIEILSEIGGKVVVNEGIGLLLTTNDVVRPYLQGFLRMARHFHE